MLAQILARVLTLEVVPVVDIVVSVFRVPVRIAHRILVRQIFLRSPHVFRAVRVGFAWEWTLVLWDVYLIIGHQVMYTGVLLVLEPSIGDTKIVVRVDTDR